MLRSRILLCVLVVLPLCHHVQGRSFKEFALPSLKRDKADRPPVPLEVQEEVQMDVGKDAGNKPGNKNPPPVVMDVQEEDLFEVAKDAGNDKPENKYPPPVEMDVQEEVPLDVGKGDDDKRKPSDKVPPPVVMDSLEQLPLEGDIAIAGLDMDNREELLTNLLKRSGGGGEGAKWAWKKQHITWRLYNWPSTSNTKISHDQIVRDIEHAYELWSSVTPLTFERVYSGNADMRLGFETRDHGDGFAFDERGGVAGHAFAPATGNPLDGDVHFDDDEIFTEDGKFGTNFLYVATHEIGHGLGLFHSTDSKSIMQGWVMPGLPYEGERLPYFDSKTITKLYGKKEGLGELPTDAPTVPPTEPPPFDCKGGEYAATVNRGSLMLFQNTRFWRFNGDNFNSNLIGSKWGNPIEQWTKNFPVGVEAAFTLFNGTTVYIKGREWHSYNLQRPAGKQEGNPGYIDASFNDERKGITYYFRGDQVQTFSWRTNDRSSWQPISSMFQGLPEDLSAAFTDDRGDRFFMKGDQYWLYTRKSNTAEPGYPKQLPNGLCGSA